LEDEHAFRTVLSEVLRNQDFIVLEASDMTGALHACEEYQGEIDLSIVDVKNGTQPVRRLAERYPRMSVLFVGDAPSVPVERKIPELKTAYLQKPLTSNALLQAVRQLVASTVSRHGA
jgi:DNA-binding response OmpR family regulator